MENSDVDPSTPGDYDSAIAKALKFQTPRCLSSMETSRPESDGPTLKETDAQIRRLKLVRERLQKHKKSVETLLNQYRLEDVSIIAKSLLEDRIFESTLRAKASFPELFQVSDARTAERKAFEAEAARSEADAVKEVVSDHEADTAEGAASGDEVDADPKHKWNKPAESATQSSTAGPTMTSLGPATRPVPSPHPIYLPYRTQHRILTMLQSILEDCCFEFGVVQLPDVVTAKNWEYSESVELTEWIKILTEHEHKIPMTVVNEIPGTSWKEVLSAISRIRHSAVHRLRTSAKGIEQMLIDAAAVTRMLNDNDRTKRIEEIGRKLANSIGEVERTSSILENKLSQELKVLAERRAELNRLEEMAIESMERGGVESIKAIGLALGKLLHQGCDDGQDLNEIAMGVNGFEVYGSEGDEIEGGDFEDGGLSEALPGWSSGGLNSLGENGLEDSEEDEVFFEFE